MKIRIQKKQILTYILILFIFFMEEFWYLIDIELLAVKGSINVDDIWLLAYFLLMLYITVKYKKVAVQFRWTYYILFLVLCTLLSSVQSYILNGQPILLGLRPQRFYIVILLSYFPLSKMIYLKKIDFTYLVQCLQIYAIFQSLLYFIQWVLTDYVIFLSVMTNLRYGEARYYFNQDVMILVSLFSMYELVTTRKRYIQNLLSVGMPVLLMLLVTKGRLALIGYGIALAFIVLLYRKWTSRKLFWCISILMAAVIMTQLQMVQDILQSLYSLISDSNVEGTLEIRELGKLYYFGVLKDHWLLGGGYPNILYLPATIQAGFQYNYLLVDNGFFAFWYIYGTLGLVVFIGLHIRLMNAGMNLYKKLNPIPIAYVSYLLVLCVNMTNWVWSSVSLMCLVLFLCYVEGYMRSIKMEGE